jgi:hypothetical protein
MYGTKQANQQRFDMGRRHKNVLAATCGKMWLFIPLFKGIDKNLQVKIGMGWASVCATFTQDPDEPPQGSNTFLRGAGQSTARNGTAKSAERAQICASQGHSGRPTFLLRGMRSPTGKNHWEGVRIGAKKRANPHTLRQLGALRRCKKRIGLS